MALLEPWKCHLGHVECQMHSQTKPDLSDLPGPDWPRAGSCYYGCLAPRLWYASHMGGRWYCKRHLRRALKAGGYPIKLDE